MRVIGVVKAMFGVAMSLFLTVWMYLAVISGLWLLIAGGVNSTLRHRTYLILGTLLLGVGLGLLVTRLFP